MPSEPPSKLEAKLLNSTSVFLKWQPPAPDTVNGVLVGYQILIRGIDAHNMSRVLANMSVDATSPSLMLANLTSGISYSISIAAATQAGVGAYTPPASLRLDPNSNKLDHEFTRCGCHSIIEHYFRVFSLPPSAGFPPASTIFREITIVTVFIADIRSITIWPMI